MSAVQNGTPPPDLLAQAFQEADDFYDFPDRVYSDAQRAMVTKLAYEIAAKRGWQGSVVDAKR